MVLEMKNTKQQARLTRSAGMPKSPRWSVDRGDGRSRYLPGSVVRPNRGRTKGATDKERWDADATPVVGGIASLSATSVIPIGRVPWFA